ncbi:MAG: sensor domain-containing diguanylate cyclase [Desulfobacteraceae bacterium]|nr:sensor domain-containing diguanylate cyclase [Desulfobacteraceae bacterium]MBU4054086.1 sensor domain-containing diguanylate cyclase [Pseudomonadota bacterium]
MDLNQPVFEKIMENLYDGLYFVDRDCKITYWNKAAEKISGFKTMEVTGRHCSDNILTHIDEKGNNLCISGCPMKATLKDGISRESEVYLHHKDGHRIPVVIRATALTDDAGEIIGGVELFSDISDQKANLIRIQELEKLALLDNLTQLANRNYLEREIRLRFEEKKRFDIPFGLIFMDIDHFKNINDTHGHDTGDKVLKFVADTLVKSARPFDIFGRWGGEEFIGIVRNIREDDLKMIADRLRALVAGSYIEYENKKINVTLSAGATIVRDDDTSLTILKRSDDLLYQSKSAGRNCITFA